MRSRRRGVRARVGTALLLTALVVLFVIVGSGSALAAPPWSDAPGAWWMNTYGVSESQAATVADGYPDGTFRPALNVTRAQFAKMAVDGLGASTAAPAAPSFTDVPATNHFYPWIEGGVAAGIISGYGDGTFGPNNSILRQQANSILGSYLAQKELNLRGHIAGNLANYPSLNTWYLAEGTALLAQFTDRAKMASVHAPATAYLVYQDVVQGSESGGARYLGPGNNLTRGQAVALILRVKAVQFSTDKPTVTSLDPSGGSAAGGNTVVITGTNFTDVTSVKFGTKNATSFVVNSSTRITAVAPSGTLGTTVDVTVTTHAGTSATSAASKYTYGVPTVTELDPAAGPAAGGNTVVITGTNFIGVTSVKFGTKSATSYVVNSPTQITAKAPGGVAGTTVDVTVTTAGGTSEKSYSSKYSYGPPTVTELDPAAGPAAGHNEVIITGTGFTAVTAVKFGTRNAVDFEVDSPTQITAIAPAGVAGTTVDVRVTTPAGTSAITVLASKYSYGAPSVAEVDPDSGPSAGGNEVVITGQRFTGVTAVKFGTKNATVFEVDSPTQITAIAPAGVAGTTVDVRVTTPAGTSAIVEADEYTYLPVVTALQPYHGPAAGGNTVVIVGYGFHDVTSVTFGTATIDDDDLVINASGTRITLEAPPGTGKVDVRVNINSVHSENTAADDYYYAPTVSSVTPNRGTPAGGNTVTIEGTGFLGAEGVYFDTTLVSGVNFHVVSATEITVKAPSHAAGTVNVRVKGDYDTGVADAGPADDYTYGAPEITDINPAEGSTGGGTDVTITGSALTGATVTFGGVAATNVIVNAAGTSLTCETPAHAAGPVDVVVTTTAGGSDTEANGFAYVSDYEIAISPASPVLVEGTTHTVNVTLTDGGEPVVGKTVFLINHRTEIGDATGNLSVVTDVSGQAQFSIGGTSVGNREYQAYITEDDTQGGTKVAESLTVSSYHAMSVPLNFDSDTQLDIPAGLGAGLAGSFTIYLGTPSGTVLATGTYNNGDGNEDVMLNSTVAEGARIWIYFNASTNADDDPNWVTDTR